MRVTELSWVKKLKVDDTLWTYTGASIVRYRSPVIQKKKLLEYMIPPAPLRYRKVPCVMDHTFMELTHFMVLLLTRVMVSAYIVVLARVAELASVIITC